MSNVNGRLARLERPAHALGPGGDYHPYEPSQEETARILTLLAEALGPGFPAWFAASLEAVGAYATLGEMKHEELMILYDVIREVRGDESDSEQTP